MKRYLLALCLFSLCLNASGQQFDPSFSLPQPLSVLYGFSALPAPDSGFIGIEKKQSNISDNNWNKYRKTITLLKYNRKMKVVKKVPLSGGENVYSAFYSDLKKTGNRFWLVYVEPALRNKIGNIMAVEVNPLTLETGMPKIVAGSRAVDLNLKTTGGFRELRIWCKSSPDQKYTYLFVCTGKGSFYLSCLDEQLNAVWGRKQKLAGVSDKMIHSAAVDNSGNIFLGYTNKSKGFVAIYPKAEAMINLPLNLDPATPKEVLLLPGKNNKVAVAGTYMQGSSAGAGVYRCSITADVEVSEIETTVFPEPLVELLDREGWASAKRKMYGLYPYYTPHLLETEEGSTDMVFEFKRESAPPQTSMLSGDILNIFFGNGAPIFTRIPKYSIDHGTIPENKYFATSSGNKVIIFYYDLPVNLVKDITANPKTLNAPGAPVLVAAVIEPDGTVKRQLAGTLQDQKK